MKTRIANQEEVTKFNDFLKENNFKLSVEALTTYPDGVAKTQTMTTLTVEEPETEEKTA